jgi:hypothetical protein
MELSMYKLLEEALYQSFEVVAWGMRRLPMIDE